MDENECLVGELRKYLSTAKYKTQAHESEQVQALKRDLNLAARVGQQLLMQLQSAEKSRAAAEQELLVLKQKNATLADENHQLACEHELMSESLGQQEAEIAGLLAKLKEAQARSDRLRRAHAAAKALEREVQLLERMQLDLRTELERRTQQREDAQKLARHLASSLAQQVAADFQDLRREAAQLGAPCVVDASAAHPVEPAAEPAAKPAAELAAELALLPTVLPTVEPAVDPAVEQAVEPRRAPAALGDLSDTRGADDVPSLLVSDSHTADTTSDATADTSAWLDAAACLGGVSIASIDLSFADLAVQPRDAATPRKRLARTALPRAKPALVRSRSHESVLSIVPQAATPPPVVSSTSCLQTTALPKAVTAISDEHSLGQNLAGPFAGSSTARSARDKLSQMRGHSAAPDRRRWAFTPFRALH